MSACERCQRAAEQMANTFLSNGDSLEINGRGCRISYLGEGESEQDLITIPEPRLQPSFTSLTHDS